jgi:hypothetical protein
VLCPDEWIGCSSVKAVVIGRYHGSQPEQLSAQGGLAIEHLTVSNLRRITKMLIVAGTGSIRPDTVVHDKSTLRSWERKDSAGCHRYALHTFLSPKNYFPAPACAAHDAIGALRQRPSEVVLADRAGRQSAEMRTNSNLGP